MCVCNQKKHTSSRQKTDWDLFSFVEEIDVFFVFGAKLHPHSLSLVSSSSSSSVAVSLCSFFIPHLHVETKPQQNNVINIKGQAAFN